MLYRVLCRLADYWGPFVVLLFVCALGVVINDYLDLPVAEWSYSKQVCVRVIQADGGIVSCDALPPKYVLRWVE